jgi:O-antigen ligase
MVILFALATNLIINWIMYLVFPESGIYREELWGNVVAQRMGGLGHPNSVARTGVISIILALSILRSSDLAPRLPMVRMLLIAVIAIGCMTMLATFSRTAIVAGSFAVGLLLLDKIFTKLGMFYTVSAVAVLIGLVVALELVSGGGFFSDSFLSMTTKTGDVEELTSATGRTAIWAEAIRLISLKPVTGYGLNSAPFLMQDFSLHPHNAVLHGLMSGGLLAGLLVFLLLVWNLFFGISSPEPLVRAISIYVLVSGIFEDTVLDTFASPSTLLWLVALMHPAWHSLVKLQRQTPPETTISS